MKAPFTGTVADCFNVVRHIQRTATITCSRNMPLSNRNDRCIELAIGIYDFRSGAIGLVLQVEAGLHAPMPRYFHHTLPSVISYIASVSGGSNTPLALYFLRFSLWSRAKSTLCYVLLGFCSPLNACVCSTEISHLF
jgi:hypothetical protein